MKKNEQGFSLVEVLVVVVIVGLLIAVGWLIWDRQHKTTTAASSTPASQVATQKADTANKPVLKDYKIDNEGLVFAYNPKISTVEPGQTSTQNDLYIENVKVKTGNVTLSVTAGISGIGGGPACDNADRNKCTVLETKKSTFLNAPVTYRLIKTEMAENCGYSGVPACNVAQIVTNYILDTSDNGTGPPYGACCGTISQDARNTNKKAKFAGSLLVTIQPEKAIQAKDLFSNQDLLETIKIIESMHY